MHTALFIFTCVHGIHDRASYCIFRFDLDAFNIQIVTGLFDVQATEFDATHGSSERLISDGRSRNNLDQNAADMSTQDSLFAEGNPGNTH